MEWGLTGLSMEGRMREEHWGLGCRPFREMEGLIRADLGGSG